MAKLNLKDQYETEWQKHYNKIIIENNVHIDYDDLVDNDLFNFDLLDIIPVVPGNDYDLDFIWYEISTNGNLTNEILINNLNKPWDWGCISKTNLITEKFIDDHPDLPFDYEALSGVNKNISIEYMLKHPDKPWVWNCIYKKQGNANASAFQEYIDNLIIDNPIIKINWGNICFPVSEKLFEYILSKPDILATVDWSKLSYNIDIRSVIKYPNMDWGFRYVINGLTLTNDNFHLWYSFVNENPRRFNLYSKTITNDMIKFNNCETKDDNFERILVVLRQYPKVPWCWKTIKELKPKEQFVLKSDLLSGWNIVELIKNDLITLEYIRDIYPDDYKKLCKKVAFKKMSLLTLTGIAKLGYHDVLTDEPAMTRVKDEFIIGLIKRDGLVDHKQKMKVVLEEMITAIYNPINIRKLQELGIFSMDIPTCLICKRYLTKKVTDVLKCSFCKKAIAHIECINGDISCSFCKQLD